MENNCRNRNSTTSNLTNKLSIFQMGLMLMSTLINILFFKGIVTDAYVQVGFLVVILFGILMDFLLIKEKKKKLDNVVRINNKSNILSIILVVLISLSWITTYYYATVKKD
ncbi:Uncharacterised protein [uncultured Clostridium sp.]|uniref:hypothetical protein n=1 Tax=uncultured Clostridium sp. TaxID=59620 RepID=UPI000821930C|nr:hypothetical protein [uncultured Clostridium sp.]SCJ93566.1 Uncharacterised protein [uncultured Clostridium sp.]